MKIEDEVKREIDVCLLFKGKAIYPDFNPESAPRILSKTVRFALIAFLL